MNAFPYRFLLVILLITCFIQISLCSGRTRININDNDGDLGRRGEGHAELVREVRNMKDLRDDDNCIRLDNGTLVCPCNTTYEGDYYPCWFELEDAGPPNTCEDCPIGSYSNMTTNETCFGELNCQSGTCISSATCPLCNAGYYSPSTKQTGCLSCDAGSYSKNGAGVCTECGPGTFSDHPATAMCKNCTLGTFAGGSGATQCSQCAAGSFSNTTGAAICQTCDVGTFSTAGASSCTPCPAGTFNPTPNAASCQTCAAGDISQPGSVSCTSCPLGHKSAVDHCVACDEGTYANGPTTICLQCGVGEFSPRNESGIIACTLCSPGSFNSLIGNNHCTECSAGTYANSPGLHSCPSCPAGNYCPDMGMINPKTCPSNFYCKAGSTSPAQCPTLYHSASDRTKCNPSASFYLVILGSILTVVIVALIGWRIRVSRRTEARRQNKSLEIDRLIPKPREGPIYSGW